MIGVAPGPRGVSIDFHNTQGPCLGDAMMAVFSSPDGTKIPGCYLTTERAVRIVFLDGDVLVLPISAVKRPTEL